MLIQTLGIKQIKIYQKVRTFKNKIIKNIHKLKKINRKSTSRKQRNQE